MYYQGFDGFFDWQLEVVYQGCDGFGVGCVDQVYVFGGVVVGVFVWYGFGFFDVCGVVGVVVEDDIVFVGVGQYVEFMGVVVVDGVVVGLYGMEIQVEVGEDFVVCLVYFVVGLLQ